MPQIDMRPKRVDFRHIALKRGFYQDSNLLAISACCLHATTVRASKMKALLENTCFAVYLCIQKFVSPLWHPLCILVCQQLIPQTSLPHRRDHNMTNRMTSENKEQLPIDLTELMNEIEQLPGEYRERLSQPLNRVVEYTRRRRRILNLIQEALSQLRMDMKYLMFDLEATRRERDHYKSALED